ncbi:hypothetical protein [Nocardia asteroides]|uniref:hypothetical protein n=1 Tax=Nocardia asteroides TaxID=1824 RepID=UPI001E51020F|nr:hypothetical protein [Nocardia asteroides]UGT53209.1 hypothetical protein LTT85_21260 [Nocardia asteroides]
MDNPFGAYLSSPEPARRRPQGKRRRRRRREAEPQTIGTNPETWPPPDPEPYTEVPEGDPHALTQPIYRDPADEDGFTGDWNDWHSDAPVEPAPQRGDEVDWNDWATTTATEQSGDRVEMPVLPRLKDFGGGGPISRRPRKKYDDERYDDPHGRAKAAAAVKGIVGALLFVLLVGVAAAIFLGPDEKSGSTQQAAVAGASSTAPTQTAVAPPPAHAVAGCESFRSQSITISAERGDTASPQGAILGFEYSYYVDRDAAKARTYVTDDAHVGDEAALAAGIATFPTGVKYCIHITRADATDPTLWNVTVQQQWPGEAAIEKIQQTMRTAEVAPGRYRITSIDHRR